MTTDKTIALQVEQLADLLLARGWRMATAESCTGGGMAYHCTHLAGSSAWFEGGVICYSNTIKEQVLGVSAQILDEHGAVSTACARGLVEGVQQLCNTDVSVSVTGIAGPSGGSADKPVGMVCFGFQVQQNIWTDIQYFTGTRADVRRDSIQHGLQSIINYLRNNK